MGVEEKVEKTSWILAMGSEFWGGGTGYGPPVLRVRADGNWVATGGGTRVLLLLLLKIHFFLKQY